MSSQQDPVAASAPFGARTDGQAVRPLAQGKTFHAADDGAVLPRVQSEPRTIEVLARRFGFEPSRIEVTEGERVRLVVKSGDGVHGVEIKKFKVKRKIPRGGEPVTIDFVASAAGEFPILCSEYCGDGHENMKGMLVVAAKPR
jgi:cytochrome c oxidase subunit 2